MGDKTRMQELSKDEAAFVRPSPTNSHLGGIALHTNDVVLLCEAAQYVCQPLLVRTGCRSSLLVACTCRAAKHRTTAHAHIHIHTRARADTTS